MATAAYDCSEELGKARSDAGTDCGEGLESPPASWASASEEEHVPEQPRGPVLASCAWTVPTIIQHQTNTGIFWLPMNIPVMTCVQQPGACLPGAVPLQSPQRIPEQVPLRGSGRQAKRSGRRREATTLPEAERTTVMFRNTPNNLSRDMLVQLLHAHNFAGLFDFVYVPIDFKTRVSMGYAFLNFVDAKTAARFFEEFEGFADWPVPSRKVASVSWSNLHQGLEAHLQRYRSSPVMADDVPDEFKPAVFSDGVRVPFPGKVHRPHGHGPTFNQRWR